MTRNKYEGIGEYEMEQIIEYLIEKDTEKNATTPRVRITIKRTSDKDAFMRFFKNLIKKNIQTNVYSSFNS